MTTDGRQKKLDFDAQSLQNVGDLRKWVAAEFGYADPSAVRLSAPGPLAMEDDDDFLTEFSLADGGTSAELDSACCPSLSGD